MLKSYYKIDPKEYGYNLPMSGAYLLIVLLIAFILRLFACLATPVINPDGALYIHQARAIHYGEWKSLTSCGLNYISNYPILIAGVYYIVQNWIVTARMISCGFGLAAMIPLWLIARRFFEERISILLTLIFAVTPMFVSSSADIIRDPIAWFFILCGIYGFILGTDRNSFGLLAIACLSFIMAAWARIEALLFPIISVIYLAYFDEEKIRKIIMFLSPILFMGAAVFIIAVFSGSAVNKLHRIGEVPEKIIGPFVQYQELRKELKEASLQYHNERLGFFLTEARSGIWLVAVSTLINRIPEAFFHPFFLIAIIGIIWIKERLGEELWVIYFIMLAVSAILLLYLHILHKWIAEYRFFAILIFPSLIFTGLGLEKILNYFALRFPDKEMQIFVIVALLIVLSVLPKNLSIRDGDKLIFKEIGQYIANYEKSKQEIPISASAHTQRWVSFYANLSYEGAPCPESLPEYCWEFFPNDDEGFMRQLREKHIRYLLWVEKHWSSHRFDFFKSPYYKDFRILKRWRHQDTGEMILFRFIGD